MKKSIIALAALAALTAQADNTTLYGEVKADTVYSDGGKDGNSSTTITPSGKIGVKGGEDLGNGMSAFFHYRGKIKGGLETNKAYAGLKTEYGTVSVGKQPLPVDDLGNYDDPFNSLTPDHRNMIDSTDAGIVYTAPEMYQGLSMKVGMTADGKGGIGHNHIDVYSAAVTYEANGLFAGLGYTQLNDDSDADAFTLGLGYANDQFEIGSLTDYTQDDDDDGYAWTRISALYNVTPMDAVYIGADSSFALDDADEALEGWTAAVGYQHKFSKRTKMWTEYSFSDAEDGSDWGDEENNLSIGLKTTF